MARLEAVRAGMLEKAVCRLCFLLIFLGDRFIRSENFGSIEAKSLRSPYLKLDDSSEVKTSAPLKVKDEGKKLIMEKIHPK